MTQPTRCENCLKWADRPTPGSGRCIFIDDAERDCWIARQCPDCGFVLPRPQAEIDAITDPAFYARRRKPTPNA